MRALSARVTGRLGILVALCAASVVAAPGTPAVAAAGGTVFSYTGAEQTYGVPTGVTQVQVVAVGAPGGASPNGHGAGFGGIATADLAVTSGQALEVEVGGAGGQAPYNDIGGAAGWNGGGEAINGEDPSAAGGVALATSARSPTPTRAP